MAQVMLAAQVLVQVQDLLKAVQVDSHQTLLAPDLVVVQLM
jgi:hypothetical protein